MLAITIQLLRKIVIGSSMMIQEPAYFHLCPLMRSVMVDHGWLISGEALDRVRMLMFWSMKKSIKKILSSNAL